MNLACHNDLTVRSIFLLSRMEWGSNTLVGQGSPARPDGNAFDLFSCSWQALP